MFPLYRYLSRDLHPGAVGIEIETEFKIDGRAPDSFTTLPTGWMLKGDGSLRNQGIEFCGRKPFTLEELPRRLKSICDFIKKDEYDLLPENNRCGVHVHVNVGDFSLLEYYTAATAYWLLENLMMRYAGEDAREGNAYCLRVSDAEAIIDGAIRDVRSPRPLFGDFHHRYSSQNLSCTRRYCSMEYRGLRGTYDHQIIGEWAKALYTLSRKAKETAKDPEHLYDWYCGAATEDALKILFEDNEAFIEKLLAIPDCGELMRENIDRVDSFAYVHNWDKWYARHLEKWGPSPRVSTNTIAANAFVIDMPEEDPYP